MSNSCKYFSGQDKIDRHFCHFLTLFALHGHTQPAFNKIYSIQFPLHFFLSQQIKKKSHIGIGIRVSNSQKKTKYH